jgi:hypothetical protein
MWLILRRYQQLDYTPSSGGLYQNQLWGMWGERHLFSISSTLVSAMLKLWALQLVLLERGTKWHQYSTDPTTGYGKSIERTRLISVHHHYTCILQEALTEPDKNAKRDSNYDWGALQEPTHTSVHLIKCPAWISTVRRGHLKLGGRLWSDPSTWVSHSWDPGWLIG